jgi:hypothetical protein
VSSKKAASADSFFKSFSNFLQTLAVPTGLFVKIKSFC